MSRLANDWFTGKSGLKMESQTVRGIHSKVFNACFQRIFAGAGKKSAMSKTFSSKLG